ncbi:glutamate--tRNA ligase [Candidatus Dependentiae bacterium]|nr:glutamate--tRNA ligase [Candidatus Dependentiae bacterium]
MLKKIVINSLTIKIIMNRVRTRFAPSPTGIMHIGNVRAALLNYLFAAQNNGIFILRIEDTDQQRNIDQGTQFIIKHLNWLGLMFQEGPNIGGAYAPYFQSQRSDIYKKYLQKLHSKNLAYQCFCTPEELETRKNRQIVMKKPPRYEGTCLKISQAQIAQNIAQGKSFIWRMKIDSNKKVQFKDMARGTLEFDLQHFSDFPLTREDGSFTFIFANCVDDCEMAISHVFRGEEHLSNTVSQTVLYHAFDYPLPTFWHLPILCNQDGKKLSKRDRGFSLEDVQNQGYLPEAICNYLGILGCSFEKEIMSLEEMSKIYRFDNLHGASQIRYDIEKLKWLNHKWIADYNIKKLTQLCKPFLATTYNIASVSDQALAKLIKSIQTDMQTLTQVTELLKFYFVRPHINTSIYNDTADQTTFIKIKKILLESKHEDWTTFINTAKAKTLALGIENKILFATIRIFITGSAKGMQVQDLFTDLGNKEFFERIENA